MGFFDKLFFGGSQYERADELTSEEQEMLENKQGLRQDYPSGFQNFDRDSKGRRILFVNNGDEETAVYRHSNADTSHTVTPERVTKRKKAWWS